MQQEKKRKKKHKTSNSEAKINRNNEEKCQEINEGEDERQKVNK